MPPSANPPGTVGLPPVPGQPQSPTLEGGDIGNGDLLALAEWAAWRWAGQRAHFRNYAPSFLADQRQVAYGAIRYTNEVHRLYGVLDRRLAEAEYMAGEYGIADGQGYEIEELLAGTKHVWRGSPHRWRLDPNENPAAIFRLTLGTTSDR